MESVKLLVMAAMGVEVEPLIDRLGLERDAHEGVARTHRDEAGRLAVLVTGVGAERAARAVAEAIDRLSPEAIAIAGFAGALSDSHDVADVVTPASVVDATGGEALAPSAEAPWPPAGRLVTVRRIAATPEAKRELAARYEADLADMETASAARVCVERRVPWLAIRAISDTADEALPEGFADLVKPDGEPDLVAATRYAMTHPWQVPALMRLKANTTRAAEALADRLVELADHLAPRG